MAERGACRRPRDGLADDDRAECRTDDQTDARARDSDACADEVHRFVSDCSDGDCCLASWIGDGHCDGVTQEWDCDLSCYDDDGGDCAPPTANPTAAPIDSQFYALEPDRPETQSYETVEFFIASSLCLASVSAAGVGPEGAPLQGLVDSANTREEPLSPDEHLLLLPPEAEEGDTVYGKACTDNWNAVFRDKDEVTFTFKVAERDPGCKPASKHIYPWDHVDGGVRELCSGHADAVPHYEAQTEHDIVIRVADGVSKTETTDAADDNEFSYTMTAARNPFAPFSKSIPWSSRERSTAPRFCSCATC